VKTQDLCNAFKVNIAYYSYNEEKNSYKQESLIQKENNEETTIVNILLHIGSTSKSSVINHAMVIINVEKLTGLRFCSKCGIGFRISDHHTERFNKHCNECDGSFIKSLD
jgi:NADH pyrophosphatase NudC (nudix superfamily)